ncbi:MAG: aminopeptidase N [Alphaproteobacteria bacterium]|nr:aminopeptidase N [Alphaproteobacteria bacterium]
MHPDAQEAHPKTIRLADYAPPDFLVDTIDLEFDLDERETVVRARLALRRNPARPAKQPLVLDGQGLALQSIAIDGHPLSPADYALGPESLTITKVPDRFTLDTMVRIDPQANTALEGLYVSSGNFCTQCEAEGFRRITFYPDRPDVMARYTTMIRADRGKFPVLLSNGNLVASGSLTDGRHYAKWEDPFPKPAYLFALVAGRLVSVDDRFVTRSGRKVELQIFVEPGNQDKCGHAMESLKHSMKWDEDRYGLEYDLDRFMIVAVGDFNMGAMENKGLNIFNTKYILARHDTATDDDYHGVEGVVAHEYFHNWTGNRVTCRDWFQLSLKEGLTVFRDQEFTADMNDAAVERIAAVRGLRALQFPEDASPMAHPVRPDSYIEINNFYTKTVYEKGAEVVRMYQTLLGRDGFRRGMDLYFKRHDGQAVTCDDFLTAMADANGADFTQFKRWYSQAGTPRVKARGAHDKAARRYTLTLEQSCPPTPGQPAKEPFHIPVAVGLLGADGKDLKLRLEGEPKAKGTTRVLDLKQPRQEFVFEDVAEPPLPSLLRGFSAPVKLDAGYADAELVRLMAEDSDGFARWEAGQTLACGLILGAVEAIRQGKEYAVDPGFVAAAGRVLADETTDKSLLALMLSLPSEAYLGEQMETIDVDALHAARQAFRAELARVHRARLLEVYHAAAANDPQSLAPVAVGRRALRNLSLAYLTTLGDDALLALATAQAREGRTMTEVQGALVALCETDASDREAVLADFYAKWKDEPLVVDKWFQVQAGAARADAVETVARLLGHPAFSMRNPNKVRALIGAFAAGNQVGFHRADGAGYAFLADRVLELDPLNPQVAARLLGPMARWRRFDTTRQAAMRAQLERIAAKPGLSKDVFEIASKSLAPS